MKFQKSSLFEIAGLALIIISILGIIDEYVPDLYIYTGILLIVSILYEVYNTKKYLKTLPSTEMRIRNRNDSYANVFPFIMGSMMCLASTLFFFITEGEKLQVLVYFLLGLTFLYKGINFMPGALLRFDKNMLNFQNGTVKKKIRIGKSDSFSINNDSIIFNLGEAGEQIILQHLELNDSEIKNLEYFLKANSK